MDGMGWNPRMIQVNFCILDFEVDIAGGGMSLDEIRV